MRISARADYAVRAVTVLAAASDRMSSEQIATEADVPGKYLESILTALRRAHVVESRRGASGGYLFAREPASVTVADVIRAVDGPLVFIRDARPSDLDPETDPPAMVRLWVALRASVRNVLESTTVADLARGSLPPAVRALADDPASWRNSSALGD